MGLLLSVLAFAGSCVCGRISLGAGMAATLAAGYLYGVLRAQFYDGFSHFLFDAAVLGLYLARFTLPRRVVLPARALDLWPWFVALACWPVVVFALCPMYSQHLLIQLVGLRAALWYVPFLLLGATARPDDLKTMARAAAVLNLLALGFALGESSLGLEPFFPRNPTTELLYACHDVADNTAPRIPACFTNSAVYGWVMVATLPLLAWRWQARDTSGLEKALMVAGMAASALGAFLCASRTAVIFLFLMGGLLAYHVRRLHYLLPVLLLAAGVGYVVAGDERLQRFTTLQDTDSVADRVGHNTPAGLAELLLQYPLGAGLGSAWGTNVPAFLQHLQGEVIGAENEYVRVGIEQGLIGLGIWIGFLVWVLGRRRPPSSPDWSRGTKLMYGFIAMSWSTSWIGVGSLTAVPGAVLLLFETGVCAQSRATHPRRAGHGQTPSQDSIG